MIWIAAGVLVAVPVLGLVGTYLWLLRATREPRAPAETGVLPESPLASAQLEPDGWVWGRIAAQDGMGLRWGRLSGSGRHRGHALVLGGYSEFAEKYFELARELASDGWTVWTIDWAGQGGSDRFPEMPHAGWTPDFERWVSDLDEFWRGMLAHASRGCRVVVAHSMGAHIVLRWLIECRPPVDAVALSAPMTGIDSRPFPSFVARRLAGFAVATGFERRYIPGGRDWRAEQDHGSRLARVTSDPVRVQVQHRYMQEKPELRIGSPTFGWLHEAFRSIDELQAKGRLEEIETPVLVGIPEKDLLVPPRDQRAAALRLKEATIVEVKGSLHEPLMERDEIRGPFVARIMSFFARIAEGLPEDAASDAFRKVAALMRRE